MKKIFNVKLLILSLFIISLCGIFVFTKNGKVEANTNVTMDILEKEIAKVEERINGLEAKIVTLETSKEELEKQIEENNKKISSQEKTISNLEKELTNVKNRTSKIEAREDYLYKTMSTNTSVGNALYYTANHILKELK